MSPLKGFSPCLYCCRLTRWQRLLQRRQQERWGPRAWRSCCGSAAPVLGWRQPQTEGQTRDVTAWRGERSKRDTCQQNVREISVQLKGERGNCCCFRDSRNVKDRGTQGMERALSTLQRDWLPYHLSSPPGWRPRLCSAGTSRWTGFYDEWTHGMNL